jgi:hypothetical protein
MNEVLTEKRTELSRLMNVLEEKKQSKDQNNELFSIEAEIALAQKGLADFLAMESREEKRPSIDHVGEVQSKVTQNVVALLKKRDSQSAPLSEFANMYSKEFKSNITEDASGPGQKRRKLKDILEMLSVCDLVDQSSSNTKQRKGKGKRPRLVVQLRKDSTSDSPPLKLQKIGEPPKDNITLSTSDTDTQAPSNLEEAQQRDTDEPNEARLMNYAPLSTLSILPPLPNQTTPKYDNGELVAKIIKRYMEDGPIKADDLLDEMLDSNKEIPPEVDALRFLFQLELDPEGNMKSPECVITQDKLSNAICLSARAMDIKQKYPLQAREIAQKALAVASAIEFPTNWIIELQSIVDVEMTKRLPSQSSVVKDSIASDSWQIILQQDKDAPSVMLDSILPMIGLEAVKESLVGMYHRCKLAQEQGDGSASSYNGKHVTTVYYLVNLML